MNYLRLFTTRIIVFHQSVFWKTYKHYNSILITLFKHFLRYIYTQTMNHLILQFPLKFHCSKSFAFIVLEIISQMKWLLLEFLKGNFKGIINSYIIVKSPSSFNFLYLLHLVNISFKGNLHILKAELLKL